jgi:hypothetical protein
LGAGSWDEDRLCVKHGQGLCEGRLAREERSNAMLAYGSIEEASMRALGHRVVAIAVGCLAIIGLLAGVTVVPAGASTIKSDEVYARAQLLKLSDVPAGYTKSGNTWVGTSDSGNSSSMFTSTQIPDITTCLGEPPALSVVAAEASSPDFQSQDGNTDVFDVADVYTSVNQAKSDFPSLTNPKFAKCFLQVEGSSIVSTDQATWPSGSTFGTPVGTVSHEPKFGDQSGLVEVQVPVTLPQGQGASDDFFVALIIRQGRSVAELILDQGNTTPSAALTNSLAHRVIANMKAKPPGNSVIAA